jgi:transposase
VRQRTQTINALRGHLAEYGRIAAQGPSHVARLIDTLRALDDRIRKLDVEIAHRAKKDEEARRLMTIPGIGPITATALVALAPDPATFGKGRDFGRTKGWYGAIVDETGSENQFCTRCIKHAILIWI